MTTDTNQIRLTAGHILQAAEDSGRLADTLDAIMFGIATWIGDNTSGAPRMKSHRPLFTPVEADALRVRCINILRNV